jgi:hypothetical protein
MRSATVQGQPRGTGPQHRADVVEALVRLSRTTRGGLPNHNIRPAR